LDKGENIYAYLGFTVMNTVTFLLLAMLYLTVQILELALLMLVMPMLFIVHATDGVQDLLGELLLLSAEFMDTFQFCYMFMV
jgi:hypothetical protein